jgi:hypothetical protein
MRKELTDLIFQHSLNDKRYLDSIADLCVAIAVEEGKEEAIVTTDAEGETETNSVPEVKFGEDIKASLNRQLLVRHSFNVYLFVIVYLCCLHLIFYLSVLRHISFAGIYQDKFAHCEQWREWELDLDSEDEKLHSVDWRVPPSHLLDVRYSL